MKSRRVWAALIAGLLAVWPIESVPADGLTYLAHAPTEPSAHPPLIVLLHGAGADERDMITMWRDLPPDFVVISPRAPFCSGNGCRWYRKAGATPRSGDLATSRKVVDLVVDEAVKRFDADPKRVFLGGFSQGGVMTYDIALREPAKFRGAVVMSGSLFSTATHFSIDRDKGTARPAFFIGHGTADPRIPFAAAKSADTKLEALGFSPTFHAYPGMRHETGAEEMRDLASWLTAHAGNAARAPNR